MIQNRKILFIIGGGVIALLLLILFLFASVRKAQKSSGDNNQISQIPLTPVPTDAQKTIETYPFQPEKSALQNEENFYKNNSPDIYLANLLPIQNDDFEIVSRLDQDGAVLFIVTSKSGSILTAQEAFNKWAQSSGLSTNQISSLRITYK